MAETIQAKPETARGRAIYEMLLAVHAGIRRDLERVDHLAAQTLVLGQKNGRHPAAADARNRPVAPSDERPCHS